MNSPPPKKTLVLCWAVGMEKENIDRSGEEQGRCWADHDSPPSAGVEHTPTMGFRIEEGDKLKALSFQIPHRNTLEAT